MPLAALSEAGRLYRWVSGDIHQKRPCGHLSTVVYMAALSSWICETEAGRTSGVGETAVWLRCMALLNASVFSEDSFEELEAVVRQLVDVYAYATAAGLIPAEGTEWTRRPDHSLDVERGLVASLDALKQIVAALFLQPGRWIGRVCEEYRRKDIAFDAPALMHFEGDFYEQAAAHPAAKRYATVFVDPHSVVIFARRRLPESSSGSGDIVIALPGVTETLNTPGLLRIRESWIGSLGLALLSRRDALEERFRLGNLAL